MAQPLAEAASDACQTFFTFIIVFPLHLNILVSYLYLKSSYIYTDDCICNAETFFEKKLLY